MHVIAVKRIAAVSLVVLLVIFVSPATGPGGLFSKPRGPAVADAQALTQISAIQGSAHTSPLVGTTVTTEGIVTAELGASTFWIQDPTPDGSDATSEGLLIFRSGITAAVAVGDLVQVTGRVTEFRPGGAATANLTTTELAHSTANPLTVVKVSAGNPLPAPTVIGAGGRVPPTTVINDDTAPGQSVETSGTFDHTTDGIDFYESLEGMRVQINNAVAVGPRNNFGEIPVLADGGAAPAGLRTARGGIVIQANDFNPERVILDDALIVPAPMPAVKVGDGFAAALVGIMDYSFGNFKLLVSAAPVGVDGGLAREVGALPTDHQVVVGTYNVENLDPGDGPAAFQRHAQIIVNHLRSPDVLAVEEIQDNNGATNDGTTDASATWNLLIAAIQAEGGPAYQFRQIDPLNNQDGGQPGGNIRVGFLFRTDRGVEFIDRPGGDATTPTFVVNHPSGPQLSISPGRVDPQNAAWIANPAIFSWEGTRKPLAGEFRMRGKKVFLIANHWKSKTQDQPLFGRFQPPTRFTENQRNAQAQVVRNFVDQILAADPNANVVVLGDLNDFEFSVPVTTLEGGGATALHTLIETLDANERYSYVFEGNSQTLDHIVVSNNLFTQFPISFDVIHVNSEFPDQASDHEPQVARLDLRGRPRP